MKAIEKDILKRLSRFYATLGFAQEEKDSLYFKKEFLFGFDQIGVTIRYFKGEFQGNFYYSKRFNDVENPIWKYKTELRNNRIQNDTVTIFSGEEAINSSIKEVMNEDFAISIEDTPEGIASFCDLLEYNIIEKILPLAEKFNDIKYLEKQIRTSLKGYNEFSDETLDNDLLRYLNRQDFRFRIPIIAKLAKINDFDHVRESMVKEMKRLVNIDKKYQYMLDAMYRLLKDLEYTPPQ